jgi:hypothetical protein
MINRTYIQHMYFISLGTARLLLQKEVANVVIKVE